jgi:hypothetical protein
LKQFERLKPLLLKYHRPLFYGTWLLLHIVQAANTELFDDEAYYWVYSKFPAWGYFDHPPMIAVLIKIGYTLFHNELGVRLITVLLSTASIAITESLTEKKNPFLFYAICASVALAQIGGMLAVPDAPLMFFVALFFYSYRRFAADMNIVNTAFISVITALMFYTKYHALLIVVFTALSNFKLFRRYQFYIAGLLALALFMPHLYWQHQNGYPSLQFHLFERNAADYHPWYSIEYILSQLLLTGPLTGWLLLAAAALYRTKSASERALKFSYIGIYIFFFISSLRGKVEANWTVPSFIGLIVLSHQYLLQNIRLRKILYYTAPVTVAIVLIGRVIMMADLPPAWWIVKDEFHDNRLLVRQVATRAKSNRVVFLDTYQKPSKYWFYSNDTAFGLNTPTYRRNNFNYWPIEEKYIGRPAFVFGAYDRYFFNNGFLSRNGEKNGARFIPLFYSFSKVFMDDIKVSEVDSSNVSVHFSTKTPSEYLPLFQQAPYDTASVYISVYKNNQVFRYVPSGMKVRDIVRKQQQNIVTVDMPLPPGDYMCKFAISNCLPGRPSLNSAGFEILLSNH